MSASKLEKTVVNLEKRLKQEFHAEMQRELKQHTAGLEARLSTLEAQLKKIQTEPLVVCDIDRVSDIVEERLDRGDLNLPEAHLALEAKESVAPLELDAVAPEGGEEVEKPMEHTPEEEEVEEPVAFTETAWNLVLVLGLTGSGTLDACIACLLLICSAAMQITFSVPWKRVLGGTLPRAD
ncbi:unnamed protein product [Durusdinium trenchii]|uniref:Uncharacterized protein n=1 Tax=Durusdinium trenchii TaxID=1381693 RepID=A0ABP0PAP8_9DINO